jgi:zinc protease
MIWMPATPDKADRAIEGALEILKQVRDGGVTQSEVAIAKDSLRSSYRLALADPDTLNSFILANHVYGLPLEELRLFPQKIESVTWQEVNQEAKALLHPDRIIVVTVIDHS